VSAAASNAPGWIWMFAGVVVGVAIGGVGVSLWPAADSVEPISNAESAPPEPSNTGSTRTPTQAPAASETPAPLLDSAPLAACRTEVHGLRARLVSYEGEPEQWPAGFPDIAKQPTALTETLTAAWSEHGELLGVDCEEHPCVAIVRIADPAEGCCVQFADAMPASLADEQIAVRQSYMIGLEGGGVAAIALAREDGGTANQDIRTTWRLEMLSDAYAD